MRFFITTLSSLLLVAFSSCSQTPDETRTSHENPIDTTPSVLAKAALPNHFGRDSIEHRFAQKRANNELQIIHVFVPLCDNDNQGIVKVNSSLGNGLNLRTNLYWGAGYGVKTHFSRSSSWQLKSSILDPTVHILERVIFKHATKNVLLVADAYRGDRMIPCLQDYFNTLAGIKEDSIQFNDSTILLSPDTDLVVFNGHNGLMDEIVEAPQNVDGRTKDAIAIACISNEYFNSKLNEAGGYPLVMTKNFLAPEAYVLHHVFDSWMAGNSPEETRLSAATGYHSIQKCGMRGASNLFVSGW